MFHALLLQATHNRAGSITYRHLSGNTYEFTVKTCTKSTSDADRPELEIKWGDGTLDTIDRISINASPLYDVQENVYIGTHDFTGPGSYIISVEDPNRNAGIVNISASVDQRFCVQATPGWPPSTCSGSAAPTRRCSRCRACPPSISTGASTS